MTDANRNDVGPRLMEVAAVFIRMLQNTSEVQQIPGFDKTALAVIGGVAVIHFSQHRATKDVDFAVVPSEIGPKIKSTLAQAIPKRCQFFADRFMVKVDDGWVQVDLVPGIKLPCLPKTMIRIHQINPDNIPIAAPLELLVMKSACCPIRGIPLKAKNDAKDVAAMMRYTRGNHLRLLWPDEQEVVRNAENALRKVHPDGKWDGKFSFVR
ncbi:hypothetical protein BDV18DRAFT_164226 [Aspergillus unguis]